MSNLQNAYLIKVDILKNASNKFRNANSFGNIIFSKTVNKFMKLFLQTNQERSKKPLKPMFTESSSYVFIKSGFLYLIDSTLLSLCKGTFNFSGSQDVFSRADPEQYRNVTER